MLSIVIPIYKNASNLHRLLPALDGLARECPVPLEVVFVIDGSPDESANILRAQLPSALFRSQVVILSRNFGAFSAIQSGLEVGSGDYFAVMAADLQEPPQLALQFFDTLRRGEADIVFGVRAGRSDPFFDELMSTLFWFLYRILVLPEMPPGGVDVFGCTRAVRDRLQQLREANVNIVALLLWLGFRRAYISYERQPRLDGRSAWTLRKKLRYSLDSVFNYTDLPIQLLLGVGSIGTVVAIMFAVVLLVARLTGRTANVPGYTAVALAITFFGSIASLGLGIIGQYLWLVLQNVRSRPNYVVSHVEEFPSGGAPVDDPHSLRGARA